MLLQYEELLLKRRHPDYRPLSLDWNHKLLPRSSCQCAFVWMCVYVCVRVWVCVCIGNRSQGNVDMNGTQDGVLFSISSKCSHWCQYNHDRHNPPCFISLLPPPLHTPLVLQPCHLFIHLIYSALTFHSFSPSFSPDILPNSIYSCQRACSLT